MTGAPRRGLFWRVYPTLLVSLLLTAVLSALAWRLVGGPMMSHAPRAHSGAVMHMHLLAMLLTVAAVVGVAAYPVIAGITRRLEALRASVEAWGAGDLRRRAEVDGGDEVAAVAASFNAAADRADALLTAHKALLAHASHELRSPLARLAMAAELLADRFGDDRDGRDEARAIRREVAELDALVEEILLASRLDQDVGPAEQERVDALALAAEEAARANISLREAAADTGPFEVIGSPRLIRRLIRNLIDNALRHGAPPVDLEVRRGAMGDLPSVAIAVRDFGPGVAPALRERVFEPFFRPDGAAEAKGGWGLGLSLVRQIARRHGGDAVCGVGGEGETVFRVRLPAAPAEGQPPSAILSR
jgi:signal transduction histidine kinase